jgi:hypothetical protein
MSIVLLVLLVLPVVNVPVTLETDELLGRLLVRV